MQKVRCHPHFQKTPTACKLLISGSISLPFSGFFSPFPRGTCPLSVRTTYLEIRGWYPDVRWMITSPTDFNINSFLDFTGLTPSLASVSSDFKSFRKKQFSFFAFARHYLRNLFWFLFLKLLRCFSSLGSFLDCFIINILWHIFIIKLYMRVSPFGYLYFSVPSIQFSLFASFRIRPRHPWEALSFLFKSMCSLFFETLHPWFLFSQYLVAYDASLLGSECYYNHFSQRNVPLTELVGFFLLSLKNIFQQQLPLPLPCYDFTSIKLTNFDPFINIHFFVNQRNSLPVYCWVLQKIPSLKVWRAVCTKLRYIFTEAFWSSITNNSCFMSSSCRAQSVLGCDL